VARKSKQSTPPAEETVPKKPAPKRATTAKSPRAKSAVRQKSVKNSDAPATGDRPTLVIVESPKKAKSINKFLGSAYVVKASMGLAPPASPRAARRPRPPGLVS
jgi:DNA topoisomerase-1